MDKFGSVGIIGLGEIGSAIRELYEKAGIEVVIYDPPKGFLGDIARCDLVHVCVPAEALNKVAFWVHLPYVIHSTVPVGTCRKLAGKDARMKIFHAPVRGNHPRLALSMQTFEMPITARDWFGQLPREDFDLVRRLDEHFGAILNILLTFWGPYENSELAKLFCTARLGMEVLFMREVYDACARHGADPSLVYDEWTRQYNAGYRDLNNNDKYTRPILLQQKGPIGGHCVMPNAQLLLNETWLAKEIVERGGEDWKGNII